MSALTPDKTRLSLSYLKRLDETPFWVISLVLHGVLLALILFVAPVREIVFRREVTLETQVITQGDELEAVIDKIRDRTVDKLRARVALLEAGQERMANNFTIINEHFQPFAEQQTATARKRMEAYMDGVLSRQTRLRDLLQVAVNGGSQEDARAFGHENLSRILTGQEEFRRGLVLLKIGGDDLLQQQNACEEEQFKVSQTLRQAGECVGSIDWETEQIAQLDTRRAGEEETLAAAKATYSVAQETFAEREETYRLQDESVKALPKNTDQDAARQAREALNTAKRALDEARRAMQDAERATKQAQERLQRTDEDVARRRQTIDTQRGRKAEHMIAALACQEGSLAQQSRIINLLRQAFAAADPGADAGERSEP